MIDPQSYLQFVNRQQINRNNKSISYERQNSLPGSGNIWINQVTKPKEFNLRTEHSRDKSFSIKSVSKVRIKRY